MPQRIKNKAGFTMYLNILVVILILCACFDGVIGNGDSPTSMQVPTRAFTKHQSIAALAAYMHRNPSASIHMGPSFVEEDDIINHRYPKQASTQAKQTKKMRKSTDRKIRTTPNTRIKNTDIRFRTNSRGQRALEQGSNILLRQESSSLQTMLRGQVQSQTEDLAQDRQDVPIAEGQDAYIHVAEQLDAHNMVREQGLFSEEVARSEEMGALGRSGFLDDIAKGITKVVNNPFVQGAAVGGAVGVVVGAGGLALILCAAQSICGGTPTPAPTTPLLTSAVVTIQMTGDTFPPPSDVAIAVTELQTFLIVELNRAYASSFISFTITDSSSANVTISPGVLHTDITYKATSTFSGTATVAAEEAQSLSRGGDPIERSKGIKRDNATKDDQIKRNETVAEARGAKVVVVSEDVMGQDEAVPRGGKRGRPGNVNDTVAQFDNATAQVDNSNATLANGTMQEGYENENTTSKDILPKATPNLTTVDNFINGRDYDVYLTAFLQRAVSPTSPFLTAVKANATSTTFSATPAPTPTTTVTPGQPTGQPTTSAPSNSPTTARPTLPGETLSPTTANPTTVSPTTALPTTASPTTASPTTASPTTVVPAARNPAETGAPSKAPSSKDPFLPVMGEEVFDFDTGPDDEESVVHLSSIETDVDARFEEMQDTHVETNDLGPGSRRMLQ